MCSHNFFQTLSTFVDFHLLGVEGSIPDQEVQSLQLNFSGKQCSSMKFEISTDMYHTILGDPGAVSRVTLKL